MRKLAVKDLRCSIREVLQAIGVGHRRMPFEDLLTLHDDLDERLQAGDLDPADWDREWDEVLRAAGWSGPEYELELDRRWDYLDSLRKQPTKHRSSN